MPRTGATFNLLTNDNYPAVDGEVIDADPHNAMLEDLAQGLTDSVSRDGSGSMSGNLNMGTHKLTNLAAGASNGDSVRFEQVQLANAVATAWENLSWANGKIGAATGASSFALFDYTAAGMAALKFVDPNADKLLYFRDIDATWQPVTLAAEFSFSGGTLGLDADLGTWAGLTPSAFFQTLVDDASSSAFMDTLGFTANFKTLSGHTFAQMRADLDLEAGTDFYSISAADAAFQPKSSVLTTYAGINPSSNVQSLLGAADYAAMRTQLSLGTAAVKNTGTSGNNVPLLDGANIFGTAIQSFTNAGVSNHYIVIGNQFFNYRWGYSSSGYPAIMDGSNNPIWYYDTNNSLHTWKIHGGGATLLEADNTSLRYKGTALASAAFKATGTSGNTVPLLDGANTWSAAQIFTGGGTIIKRSDDNNNGVAGRFGSNSYQMGGLAEDPSNNRTIISNEYGGGGTKQVSLRPNGAASATGELRVGSDGVITFGGVNVLTESSTNPVTNKQIRVPVSSETSGTLTSASSNKTVQATADITINDGVHTAEDRIEIYAGASARSIIQDTGMTLRLDGTSTTGTRSLAARGRASVYFVSNSEAIVSGSGVS